MHQVRISCAAAPRRGAGPTGRHVLSASGRCRRGS